MSQNKALSFFIDLFESNKLAPSWIFKNPVFIAQKFVEDLAFHLFISPKNQTILNPGRVHQYINQGSFPNLLTITPQDDKDEILVDDFKPMHDFIRHQSAFPGIRIAIIKTLNQMNTFAMNSLLKTLEEPPTQVFIFCIAPTLGDIASTIRSRCQIYSIPKDLYQEGMHHESIASEEHHIASILLKKCLAYDFSNLENLYSPFIQEGKKRIDQLALSYLDKLHNEIIQNSRADLAERWSILHQFWRQAKKSHLDLQHAFKALLIGFEQPHLLEEFLEP